jgi:predicted metal-binding membrane protein
MVANLFGTAPRHDRIVVTAGLAVLVAAAWVYLLRGSGIEMDKMDMGGGQVMLMAPAWTAGYSALVLLMWVVMMAAMMLPAATPAILQVVGAAGERGSKADGVAAALFFTAGYLTVWIAFSVAATLLQWALDSSDLLSDTMASRSAVAAGLLLVAVGLYQMSPVKHSCLQRCRSCADRPPPDTPEGASAMLGQGLRYGVSCLGCCGVLMGLLFVGGVMNVVWMAAIAVGVLAERVMPWGGGFARLAGAGLIAWGGVALTITLF